ncbi:MAG: DUF1499 domain-containing protein [Rhodospirillales bacterium]
MPVVVMAARWEYAAYTSPSINDISTDTENPPAFWEMPNPTAYPARNAEVQRESYPSVAPLDLSLAPEQAFQLVTDIVHERGWKVLAEMPDEGSLEAEARSFLYGFADEVAIRVTGSGNGTRIDMRSRSRLGRIDRGVNAGRIELFLSDLKTRAQTRHGGTQ